MGGGRGISHRGHRDHREEEKVGYPLTKQTSTDRFQVDNVDDLFMRVCLLRPWSHNSYLGVLCALCG